MTNDDPEAQAGVRAGDVLAGKYRIDKVLGVGGMGVVVAAHHIQLDDRVAIKFLLPQALGNAEVVTRFAREARAARKIKSEHVAHVSDVGTLENGAPYMIMEYLEGSDLSGWVQSKGPLPVEQAVEFVLQACEAIAEAHALGIVHRDLKPANLFVIRRADGVLSVKVLDFGISKTTNELSGAGLTDTAAVMGSPLYMSPEQMRSAKDTDARSDIWSIGVILHELLTANLPYMGETMAELVTRILTEAPAPIRNTRPDVPAKLCDVIAKCMEKDRGRRFQTVGQLAIALLEFAPKRAKVSVERISGVMQAAGMSDTAFVLPVSSEEELPRAGAGTAASWAMTGKPGPSRATALRVGGAIGAVAIVGIAFAVLKGRSAPTPEPAAKSPTELPAATAAAPRAVEAEKPVAAPVPVVSAAVAPVPEAAPVASAVVPVASASKAPVLEGTRKKAAPQKPAVVLPAPAAKPTAPKVEEPRAAPPPAPVSKPDSDPFSRMRPK